MASVVSGTLIECIPILDVHLSLKMRLYAVSCNN